MSYTKGPWNKNEDGRLVNDGGRIVTAWGIGIGAVYKTEESEANASLIAAAPDLLEACIEARGQMTNIRYNKPRIGMEAACASADKAIAKAKGETL